MTVERSAFPHAARFILRAVIFTTFVAGGARAETVRNVILVIGDGMGPQQVGLLEEYARNAPRSIYAGRPTTLDRFFDEGVVALSRPTPHDGIVADSASSASQLATGVGALAETIGLDEDGNPAETILEKARKLGKATGLVSDTRITHATPAAFAAHVASRSEEDEIARQLATSGVDVLLSGGLRHWIPRGAGREYRRVHGIDGSIELSATRADTTDLLRRGLDEGYRVVFNRASLREVSSGPVLGLFASSGMRDGIQERLGELDHQPTLAEMTRKALELLEPNAKGFFLMVEAGQIDWGGHDNDVGRMLHEMIRMDRTLEVIIDWAAGRDDTLVVVTADHETGSFAFSYSRNDVPAGRRLPGSAFASELHRPQYNFGDFAVLDRIFDQRKSFAGMLELFDRSGRKRPKRLATIISDYTDFTVSAKDVKPVLRRERNEYRVEGHKYLGSADFPAVCDFEAFYVYGEQVRRSLIGRVLAKQQQVVWGTGTHTSTPVPLIAFGPERAAQRFTGLLHHAEVGRRMARVLTEAAAVGTD